MQFKSAYPDSIQLKDVVRNFFEIDRTYPQTIRETIIPKGSVEIIFNLTPGSSIKAEIANKLLSIPKCFISGYNTIPFQIQLPNHQHFFGIYVHPTALAKIFGVNIQEFSNQCIDLTLVDPSMNSLWQELIDQKTFKARVNILSQWLLKRLPEVSSHHRKFNAFLNTDGAHLTVDQLSELLCYSPRHLSRKMKDLTGMNVEQMLLYKKYLQSLHFIHNTQLSLTEIAFECNFSDQAHFSRTFKSFSQFKPTEYRTRKSNISGHIFEHVR